MVKAGYKETEIGVIPAEWELCSIERDFDFYPNNTYARDCMNDASGAVRNIHYGDVLIKYGAILDCAIDSIPFINLGIPVNTVNRTVQSGDIIIADTAEDETVGKATEVVNVGNKRIVSGLHTYFLRPHAGLFAPRFLGYFINSDIYHNQLLPHIVGTKVSSIPKKGLNETIVLLPSLPEQRRIAEALSDIDVLIANLEKLIAKTKAIKQGAIQLLLTGKKRLPGFTSEWVERKISDIGVFYSGLSGKTKGDFGVGNARYVTFLNVLNNTWIDTSILENVKVRVGESQNSVRQFDLFFNTSSETPREVGMCSVLLEPITGTYLNSFCFGFRLIGDEVDPLFLSYFFNSHVGREIMSILAQGSTRYNLSKRDFAGITITVPKNDEQIAIRSVLFEMDIEIAELETKLSKYRNIKIGMMQALLTGKIRLTEQATPAVAIPFPKTEAQPAPEAKPHNRQFDDAVAIAAIVNAFYSDKYPLGRKKVQKLLYLLRRRQDVSTAAFKRKAAGPYADEVRYKGGEPIAKRNGYVTVEISNQGSKFSKGKSIGKALDYIAKWDMQPDIDWLVSQFIRTPVNRLELLATIDMAMCDLEGNGITASVDSVKKLIASNKEWRAKLEKAYFSDDDIGWAITECLSLFNSTGR